MTKIIYLKRTIETLILLLLHYMPIMGTIICLIRYYIYIYIRCKMYKRCTCKTYRLRVHDLWPSVKIHLVYARFVRLNSK